MRDKENIELVLGGVSCRQLRSGVSEAGQIVIQLISDKPEAFIIFNTQQLQEFIRDLTYLLETAKKRVN